MRLPSPRPICLCPPAREGRCKAWPIFSQNNVPGVAKEVGFMCAVTIPLMVQDYTRHGFS